MSRTITAMFDSRSEAEAARERLTQSQIDAGRVRILDQQEAGSASASSGERQQLQPGESRSDGDGGFWSSLKDAFMPDDDRQAYEEGVRRGGCLLCAQVDEGQADEAIRILEETGSVDFDQRQDQWRSEGWSPQASRSQQQPFAGQRTQEQGRVAEERIPIVEEQLKVGKREVERGGARVRSYVEETPVSEQVNLREEHVSVERRPVDRALERGELESGDMLQDREIEMTERSEEAVVGKEARVREEVVLRKETAERTENIQDTVRKTDVEVENLDRSGGGERPAFGFSEGEQRQDRDAYERGDVGRR
jgi:uncharacterized protein (TIGR02271 family)